MMHYGITLHSPSYIIPTFGLPSSRESGHMCNYNAAFVVRIAELRNFWQAFILRAVPGNYTKNKVCNLNNSSLYYSVSIYNQIQGSYRILWVLKSHVIRLMIPRGVWLGVLILQVPNASFVGCSMATASPNPRVR